MKNYIKTLLIISSLTYSFAAFAQEGQESKSVDQDKSPMAHETPGATGMMEMMQQMKDMTSTMQQMNGNMEEMMKNMTDPARKEQMQKMHEKMGQLMQEMQGMMGNDQSAKGSMSEETTKDSEKGNK